MDDTRRWVDSAAIDAHSSHVLKKHFVTNNRTAQTLYFRSTLCRVDLLLDVLNQTDTNNNGYVFSSKAMACDLTFRVSCGHMGSPLSTTSFVSITREQAGRSNTPRTGGLELNRMLPDSVIGWSSTPRWVLNVMTVSFLDSSSNIEVQAVCFVIATLRRAVFFCHGSTGLRQVSHWSEHRLLETTIFRFRDDYHETTQLRTFVPLWLQNVSKTFFLDRLQRANVLKYAWATVGLLLRVIGCYSTHLNRALMPTFHSLQPLSALTFR